MVWLNENFYFIQPRPHRRELEHRRHAQLWRKNGFSGALRFRKPVALIHNPARHRIYCSAEWRALAADRNEIFRRALEKCFSRRALCWALAEKSFSAECGKRLDRNISRNFCCPKKFSGNCERIQRAENFYPARKRRANSGTEIF